MPIETKPKREFKPVMLDTGTLERLKVLSGNAPVPAYLRKLAQDLASDTPPSMEDLVGGYSLTPIKRRLEEIRGAINSLAESMRELNAFQNELAEKFNEAQQLTAVYFVVSAWKEKHPDKAHLVSAPQLVNSLPKGFTGMDVMQALDAVAFSPAGRG